MIELEGVDVINFGPQLLLSIMTTNTIEATRLDARDVKHPGIFLSHSSPKTLFIL